MSDQQTNLSVCIIAKNEARNLPRCLASVAGLADEVLVTDTGSSDGTVSIAREAGASVDHFEWVDDFSAAYTHCLSRAQTEWVLLLDADEELLPDSRKLLRDAIRQENAFAFTLLRQDLHDADRFDDYTEMLQTRLFRYREGMRFQGRIHHQFVPSLEDLAIAEGRKLYSSNIRLRHYGYLGSDKRPKLERAERLMALELEDRPDQFYFLVELGRTRIALKDTSGIELLCQAAQQVVEGRKEVENSPGQLAQLLEHLLACDILPAGFPLSLERTEEIAEKRFPKSVPLLWQRALKRFKSNEFQECAKLLETILELGQSGGYEKLASFNPEIMQGDSLLNLGVCYTRLGKLQDAKHCFEKLLEHQKHGKAAQQNLLAIHKHLKRR